jgi:hypothetical protein
VTSSGDLLTVIRATAAANPRSLQRTIGPSGVGQPCERRLALELLQATIHNTTADTWPSTIGTAVHSWLADAFTADNTTRVAAGRPPRWLVEQKVTVRTGLTGSCDLYDLETHTVIDWKVLGAKSLNGKRRDGHPGQQYRAQAHLYGMGWANVGLPVANVAVVVLPRSGILRDTWVWTEPYTPAVAQAALDRMDLLLSGMNACELQDPGALEQFMRLLDRDTTNCDWCPFYRPDPHADPADGCAGPFEDPDFRAPARQAVAGIA